MAARSLVNNVSKYPKSLAFSPSTHNGGEKIGVVYEWIMKTEAVSSPFWFAIHEGYPPRPLFAPAIRGLAVS